MANEQETADPRDPNGNGAESGARKLPPGFERGGTPPPDGYWNPEAQQEIRGIGMRSGTRPQMDDPSKNRGFVVLKLMEPAPAKTGKGEATVLQPGQTLHMDDRKAIEGMAELIEKYGKGKVEFVIMVDAKRRVPKSTRTFWPIEWGWKIVDPSDIPF